MSLPLELNHRSYELGASQSIDEEKNHMDFLLSGNFFLVHSVGKDFAGILPNALTAADNIFLDGNRAARFVKHQLKRKKQVVAYFLRCSCGNCVKHLPKFFQGKAKLCKKLVELPTRNGQMI